LGRPFRASSAGGIAYQAFGLRYVLPALWAFPCREIKTSQRQVEAAEKSRETALYQVSARYGRAQSRTAVQRLVSTQGSV